MRVIDLICVKSFLNPLTSIEIDYIFALKIKIE